MRLGPAAIDRLSSTDRLSMEQSGGILRKLRMDELFCWALLHGLQEEVNLARNWTCACMLAEQAIIIEGKAPKTSANLLLPSIC